MPRWRRGVLQRFERLLGKPALTRSFQSLTFQQCDQCLNELFGDTASPPAVLSQTLLLQGVIVTKWLIGEQEVSTNSHITFCYGQRSVISTFLQFDTVDQFHHIRRVLEDLGLCKLNEKHLKQVRLKKPKPKA